MALVALELPHPQPDTGAVVEEDRHLGHGVDVVAVGRDPVDAVVGPQRFPAVVVALVGEAGLEEEELLDLPKEVDIDRPHGGHRPSSSMSFR